MPRPRPAVPGPRLLEKGVYALGAPTHPATTQQPPLSRELVSSRHVSESNSRSALAFGNWQHKVRSQPILLHDRSFTSVEPELLQILQRPLHRTVVASTRRDQIHKTNISNSFDRGQHEARLLRHTSTEML